jgi:hypothetical protein
VATRDLSDARRKVKNMQKSTGGGESEDAVDAVEERAADAATIDRLNAEVLFAVCCFLFFVVALISYESSLVFFSPAPPRLV